MAAPKRSKAVPRGGIDLGGTKIQAAIVTPEGEVTGDARRPTPTEGGPEGVAAQMAEALTEAADAAGVKTDSLAGVGVGSPGDVDETTGVVSEARNLPGWEGSFELGKWLSDALGAPVRLGNDVDVATNAEFELGAGKSYRSLLGVFWGTGVGGGLILDGERWLGRGAAGEIGHMVVKMGGAHCPCGRRGCMEAYAGRAAMEAKARHDVAHGAKTDLFKIMEERGRDRLVSSIWERALERGDKYTEKLLDRAVKALGAGIASAVNLLDVEAVIIGGGIGVRLGEPWVERIEKRMHGHLFVDERPPVGGAIGASLLFA
jgi:glucokinase